jgi:hypothetical protein
VICQPAILLSLVKPRYFDKEKLLVEEENFLWSYLAQFNQTYRPDVIGTTLARVSLWISLYTPVM